MILMLRLARLLLAIGHAFDGASTVVYRAYYSHEARKAAREEAARARESLRRDAAAIDDLIAETRPPKPVGSPINRGR